jgi:hypothetical protein
MGSAMKADLVSTNNPRWRETLNRCRHDVYHQPEWALAFADVDGGEAGAVVVEDADAVLLCPLIRRPLPGGRWDATSPYGYGGPVTDRPGDQAFRTRAMTAAAERLAGEGAVSWFLRLHPVLDLSPPKEPGTVVDHGPTVSVDLTKPEVTLWSETRSRYRSNINRLRRRGVVVAQEIGNDAIETFAALYLDTMERYDAAGYYHFGTDHFLRLSELLGDDLHLWTARLDDELLGSSLFTTSRASGIVQYHLAATSAEHLRLQPSKVILDEVRRWAKKEGYDTLHLGGGLGANDDGLFRFKQGFSPITLPFRTQRIVLDAEEYDRCVGRPGASADESGVFPIYRAVYPGREEPPRRPNDSWS